MMVRSWIGRLLRPAPLAALMIALATLIAPFARAEDAASAAPGPALWRVADGDTEIVLFGSVHMLREGDRWMRPALAEALDAADAVYLETSSDDGLGPLATARLLARLGRGDAPLTAQLSREGRARLARVAAAVGAPREVLETMKPWLAAFSLGAALAQSQGADPAYGVDRALESAARRAGAEIRAFETPEQQLRLLAGFSPDDQRRMLEASLAAIERHPNQLDAMILAWKAGDLDALEALTRAGLNGAPAVFEQRLLTDRNRVWAAELTRLLEEEPGRFLVVVGAGHLIGEESVQALLEHEGYAVRRR